MDAASLLDQILKQGLTPDRAKLLFSMVLGPLPGVSVPAQSRDRSLFDGTPAVSYIWQVWDSLTPEQQTVAANLIHRPLTGRERRPGPSPSASAFETPVLIPAAFFSGGNSPAYDYQQLANDADGTLAAFLHVPPVDFRLSVDYDAMPPGSEYAHTWSWFKDNVTYTDPSLKPLKRQLQEAFTPDLPLPWGCEIDVHNQVFVDGAKTPLDAQSIVTHEMFHCFQQRLAPSATVMLTLPPWIAEGEATWAMFAVVPGADQTDYLLPPAGIWKPYISQPGTIYSTRAYDAVGVFGHLSDLVGEEPVWSLLLPLVQVGFGEHNEEALAALLQGHQDEYFTSWGSSYFEVSGQKPWEMLGPGTPPTSNAPPPQQITVDANYNDLLPPAAKYESKIFQVSGSADIVTVALLTGYGRLHDKAFAIDTALDSSAPLVLCLKQGGCKCPDGSDGASLFTKNAAAPLSIGINGGDTTAQVGLVGDSLDHFCKQPDPNLPPPPPGNGGGGGGGGGNNNPPSQPPPPEGTDWGDTHIGTFDGLGYDFQVVGEYTLVRSTKDDFIVQVRQVPVLGPKLASVNQAVATKIGKQRLTFTMENSSLVLRVDGRVVSGPLPRLKAGSLTGATTAYGGAYKLTWPDGTLLRIQQVGSYAIDLKIRPAAARRGTLAGLLGDFNGSSDNDLIGKNRSKLGLTRGDINHKLASAWAVTKATSLFDYQPGQSNARFFDPNFPAKDAVAARLTNYGTAEKTCRTHGITDQRLLHDCILDLAVTNSFVFGSRYTHEQQVLAARAALARPASVASALPMFWIDGPIQGKSEPEYHFNGKKGDVIWVGYDPNCKVESKTEAYPIVFLELLDPSGKQVNSKSGCDFGRLELPATGAYTFKGIYNSADNILRYHIPVRFVRPDRRQQISYGQMVSGNIEQWAAHDVYTWTGKAGDLIVLSGQGCDMKFFTSIIDPDGHDFMGPSCREGTYWKIPKDGVYQLVVNGGEWAHAAVTGSYHFVFQGGKLALK